MILTKQHTSVKYFESGRGSKRDSQEASKVIRILESCVSEREKMLSELNVYDVHDTYLISIRATS